MMEGDRYQELFGIIKVKKIYVPWIMLLLIEVSIPDTSLIGHFSGMIAALLLRFCNFKYFFLPVMPEYEWLNAFEI